MSEIEELSFSRRNFLRAAGALGATGVPGTELSWGNGTTGSVDTSRFDPSEF